MVRMLLAGALFLLMAAPLRADMVFYQPQLRDQSISLEQWQAVFADLRQSGHEGLVVQWSWYEGEDFNGPGGWLADVVDAALEADLSIYMGLSWHDDWFPALAATSSSWGDRLHAWLQQSYRLARSWEHLRQAPGFAGWYLPLELADRGLHDPARQRVLAEQLGRLARALDAPLAVSSYFNGQQSPSAYANWLSGLMDEAGVIVWVQDGHGVASLRDSERRLYLDALDCRIGIIREAFEQASAPGEDFSARPRSPERAHGCHSNLIFSLRYLPEAAGVLDYH